jgi:hypothetical protein
MNNDAFELTAMLLSFTTLVTYGKAVGKADEVRVAKTRKRTSLTFA